MSKDDKADFGVKMNKLEEIVDWFEQDQADMTESIKKFEEGMKLATELKKELKTLENKVEKVKAEFGD